MTPTGTPASDRAFTVCRRRCGAARGPARASSRSSEVTYTRARFLAAIGAIRPGRTHQRRFGHDRERVFAGAQHREDRARDLPFALDRLVRVGVGAKRDRVADIARFRQFSFQEQGGVGLCEQLRLEIEARRQVEVGVRRPRIAVDAAVLAALVRVDRLRERNVRRLVARDDRARILNRDRRP
jgi:hypothetical protein